MMKFTSKILFILITLMVLFPARSINAQADTVDANAQKIADLDKQIKQQGYIISVLKKQLEDIKAARDKILDKNSGEYHFHEIRYKSTLSGLHLNEMKLRRLKEERNKLNKPETASSQRRWI